MATCLECKSVFMRVSDQFLPVIYAELRAMAESFLHGERDGHTLQATALVHEAYLKLAAYDAVKCSDRAHFFALAACAMRQVLVDHARARKRRKRGGEARRILLTDITAAVSSPGCDVDLIALDEAMLRLAADSWLSARIVELRFFGGLTEMEIAHALDISDRTVRRHWNYARARLFRELAGSRPAPTARRVS